MNHAWQFHCCVSWCGFIFTYFFYTLRFMTSLNFPKFPDISLNVSFYLFLFHRSPFTYILENFNWCLNLSFMFLSPFLYCIVFWVKFSVWSFNLYILPLNFFNMLQLPKQELSYIYFFPFIFDIHFGIKFCLSNFHSYGLCTGL